MAAASRVAEIMSAELAWDANKSSNEVHRFQTLATGYLLDR